MSGLLVVERLFDVGCYRPYCPQAKSPNCRARRPQCIYHLISIALSMTTSAMLCLDGERVSRQRQLDKMM